MKQTGIRISDDFDFKDGKLVVNESRQKAKKAVCDRFPKRKGSIRVVKRSASSVNRPL